MTSNESQGFGSIRRRLPTQLAKKKQTYEVTILMQIMAGMDQYSQYSSEAYTNGYQIWDMTTFIIVPRFSRDNLGCEVFYLKMLDFAQSSHIICSIS